MRQTSEPYYLGGVAPDFCSLISRSANQPIVILELQPTGFDVKEMVKETVEAARLGVDAISIAEHPLGRLHPDALALGHLIQEATNIPVLPHLSVGHRNLLAMQATLLGAEMLGLRTVLALTGDPLGLIDPSYAEGVTRVKDVRNSFELLQLMSKLNNGLDFRGRSTHGRTTLTAAVALDANVAHVDKAVLRLEKKILSGEGCVRVAISQMMFDQRKIVDMYRNARGLPIPVVTSIAPIISIKNAEFIDRRITRIPPAVLSRIGKSEVDSDGNAREGVTLAIELAEVALSSGAAGLYIVAPRNRRTCLHELLQGISAKKVQVTATTCEPR